MPRFYDDAIDFIEITMKADQEKCKINFDTFVIKNEGEVSEYLLSGLLTREQVEAFRAWLKQSSFSFYQKPLRNYGTFFGMEGNLYGNLKKGIEIPAYAFQVEPEGIYFRLRVFLSYIEEAIKPSVANKETHLIIRKPANNLCKPIIFDL
ncbi:MAG: hypothetical protein K0S08_1871 [Gammaproteobacteria bacterium]|jgi:hypothetical protein|nr:hypothetical protein [Gammaproteobacteria bacterium]